MVFFLKKPKYPKFLSLIVIIILTYLIFEIVDFQGTDSIVPKLGYIGTFIAGIFYSYGFTAVPATAILLTLGTNQNIFLAAMLAGLGSLLSDLVIFQFIRSSFSEEIKEISKEKIIIFIDKILCWDWLRKTILPITGALIIASPLPDEIGVSLFAVSKQIPDSLFILISFVLNSLGIFVVLLIGTAI